MVQPHLLSVRLPCPWKVSMAPDEVRRIGFTGLDVLIKRRIKMAKGQEKGKNGKTNKPKLNKKEKKERKEKKNN